MPVTRSQRPSLPVEFPLGKGAGDGGIVLSDPVVKLIGRSPVYVCGETSLPDVARAMSEESIGTVLVSGADGPSGIVSERDIVGALESGADVRSLCARDVMSPDIAYAELTDTIGDTARRMLERAIRHIVVARGDVPIGVVSMRDILAIYSDGGAAS